MTAIKNTTGPERGHPMYNHIHPIYTYKRAWQIRVVTIDCLHWRSQVQIHTTFFFTNTEHSRYLAAIVFQITSKRMISYEERCPLCLILIKKDFANLQWKLIWITVHRKWVRWEYITMKYAPWVSYQIRKIAGCACAGNAGNVFPTRRLQRKPLVSDHGTCVMHVPWCMPGSLTCGGGENVPGFPGACAARNYTYLVRGPLQGML